MAKKKRGELSSTDRPRKQPARQLAQVLPPPDPTLCPICGKPFYVIVGCHKICRCGYEEGCGD